jgi:1-deoxy-D-xylulose-5-phosphate reductoisomerase
MSAGGTAPAILNAANEVAVEAFLANRLSFPAIAETVESTLTALAARTADTLEVILEDDQRARERANKFIEARA